MAKTKLKVQVSWWLKFYMSGLMLCYIIMNSEPDWSKVKWWIRRSISITLEDE